jgi:phage FluMu protein gp41
MLSSTLRNGVRRRSRTISVAAERRNSRQCRPDQAERRSGICLRGVPERRSAWSGLLICLALSSVTGCGSSEPVKEKASAKQTASKSAQPRPIADAADLASEPIAPTNEPPQTTVAATPERQFRPTFPQREITDEQLRQAGLVQFSAGPVRLVTDLASEDVNSLLQVGTAISKFWPQRFGELLPAEDGGSFGFTAYVMRDRELFSEAGLLPSDLPLLFHGRQDGSEFWMNDQTRDYYRRHLFLHEATHVFMRHLGGEADDLPLWFLEGMAELVATHVVSDDGSVAFNVYPDVRERFAGLDRMELLRRDIAENGVRSIDDVTRLRSGDFARLETYAWAWALCVFLDKHTATRDGFRETVKQLRERSLVQWLGEVYRVDPVSLEVAWTQFVSHVTYRFDFERTSVAITDGKLLAGPHSVDVQSDRGWQASGVRVEAGQQYVVEAAGQITLADAPKPWVSEADGISFQYVGGLPIGRLLGSVLSHKGDAVTRARSMLKELPLGNRAEFVASVSGTLYLRVNDDWGSLADNRGSLRVTIRRTE